MTTALRRAAPALMGCLLLGALAGCGADTPDGILTKDQVADSAEVKKSQGIANQVNCKGIGEAEDQIVLAEDRGEQRPAAVFDITGDQKNHEWVDNSVWLVSDPQRAVELVSEGIDACVADYPEHYQRVDSIDGYPEAVGYAAVEDEPPTFTRRILVPLEDRVVVVGARRSGSDAFTVTPEKLLKDAVAAAKQVES